MSYGTAADVQLGACEVYFGTIDTALDETDSMGYTQGNVGVSFSTESTSIEVDQEDAAISEIITSQIVEVTCPFAEQNLERMAMLLPGAIFTEDGTTATKQKLVLSGASGGSLNDKAGLLILKPDTADATTWFTLHKAVPVANFSYSYDKESVRIIEITFKGLVHSTKGLCTFGDETAQ